MNLESLKNGHEAAWNEAHSLLWGIALLAAEKAHPSLSREDHEDAAILAISELADKIEHVTDERHLRALLATISHHQAVSLARKKFSAKRGADKTASLDAEIENHGDGILEESAPKPDETLLQAEFGVSHHAVWVRLGQLGFTLKKPSNIARSKSSPAVTSFTSTSAAWITACIVNTDGCPPESNGFTKL